MALTLPYPDMVFVPLDILTAEEQNQLVGNIEFLANQFPLAASNIANGAIGSDQLAAGAVKSDNVDWTTIGTVASGTSVTFDFSNPTATLYFSCAITEASDTSGGVYINPLLNIQNVRQCSGNFGSGFMSGEVLAYEGSESRIPLFRGSNTGFIGVVSARLNMTKTASNVSIFSEASVLSPDYGYSTTIESKADLPGSTTSLTATFAKEGATLSGAQWVVLPF